MQLEALKQVPVVSEEFPTFFKQFNYRSLMGFLPIDIYTLTATSVIGYRLSVMGLFRGLIGDFQRDEL